MPRRLIPRLLSAGLALALGGASLAADPAKAAAAQSSTSAAKAGAPASGVRLVDINLASRSELKSLPGVGDAEAARIVAARPYLTKTDLVTKNVITLEAYDALRSNIIVVHKGPPPKPKP